MSDGLLKKHKCSIVELAKDLEKWKQFFRDGANGNHEAYNAARNTRKNFEDKNWVHIEFLDEAKRELVDMIITSFEGTKSGWHKDLYGIATFFQMNNIKAAKWFLKNFGEPKDE